MSSQSAVIEVDDGVELVGDEANATDNESSFTSSVISSVRVYRQENGRRYHAYKDGSYSFPNDEIENDRLDFQHAMFHHSLGGKLHLAPIPKDAQSVLDVGTGTGIWAMEFADRYPSTRVIGTDLSPIQPGFVPPNLQFYVEDAESDWCYKEKFDLIHGRTMLGSFQDWPSFFKRSFDNLKPGAYIEMQDVRYPFGCDDDSVPPTSALAQWNGLMVDVCKKMGRPLDVATSHKRLIEEAGFVDVVEVVHKWPQNTWPKDPEYKDRGAWNLVDVLQGLQGFTVAL